MKNIKIKDRDKNKRLKNGYEEKNIKNKSNKETNIGSKSNTKNTCGDVGDWLYSDIVKDHFFKPRNILVDDIEYEADGLGVVGSPACGDMMAVWVKIDNATKRIKECKWRTFGCASAIASTSMMSVMATEDGGMTTSRAKRMTPEAIMERLGGLPDRKYHCSVLGHQALREAIDDYEKNNENKKRNKA
ncbi:MAG TPA: iron-sulfur cluster assembly scaffold protein [Candidatus Paceibacterota bacterium]